MDVRGVERRTRPVTGNGYPTSDGKPTAETDIHRDLMVESIQALQDHYAGRRVYVSGNLLVFYQEGDKRRHVSPDVLVVRGVEPGRRDNYLIWEEGRGPEVVIELTSSSTRHEDMVTKMGLYAQTLRVREYFLFDPTGDHLDPISQGYRLRAGEYQRVRDRGGRLPSQVLGLHLVQDGRCVRFWNPATGAVLPTRQERAEAAQAAAQTEAAQRRALEAEVERLRAELARRGGAP